jgi:hypothetical protein
MQGASLSRRSLLQAVAAVISTAATPFGWEEVAQAIDEAHAALQTGGKAKLSFLSAAEAADVEAASAQIIPTDDSPGAREARVIDFIVPRHLTRGRVEQCDARSGGERCVGTSGDSRHLQGSPR